MKVRHWIAALVIAAFAAAPSAALAQTTKVDDSELKSRVEKKIAESPSLKKDDITVKVDNAVVTLTGKVHSQAQRTSAGKLAKVAGVTRVENNLEVETAATTGKSTTEKTTDAAKKAGKATKDAAGEVGEAVTDAWLTTTIKTDMVNEDALKGSDINVDTNEHVVTLKGTVATPAGRTRALAIAKGTKGVKKVIDNLTIAPKK